MLLSGPAALLTVSVREAGMATKKTDRKDLITHLGELIHGIKVAMMTTVEEDGTLRSRPMWTHDRDFGRFPTLTTRNPLV